jgi:hypothetical protein
MVMRRSHLCTLIVLFASVFAAAQDTWQKECAELSILLRWRPGALSPILAPVRAS